MRSGRNAPNIVILVRIGLAIMNCALLVVPEVCTVCLFVQTTATPPSLPRGRVVEMVQDMSCTMAGMPGMDATPTEILQEFFDITEPE